MRVSTAPESLQPPEHQAGAGPEWRPPGPPPWPGAGFGLRLERTGLNQLQCFQGSPTGLICWYGGGGKTRRHGLVLQSHAVRSGVTNISGLELSEGGGASEQRYVNKCVGPSL